MAQRDIYIDTDANEVVTSDFDSTPKSLPPMIQGDTLSLRIFLLARTTTFTLGAQPYSILNNAALTLRMGIGPKDGNEGSVLFTSQFTWSKSADNTYFYGDFPLNTEGIGDEIGDSESAKLWFEIEVTNDNGFPWTVLQKNIPVQAEVIESASVEVEAGQTALTVQDADSRYLKRSGLKAIYLEDINNPGQYIVLYNENGTFKADPVTGTPPDL